MYAVPNPCLPLRSSINKRPANSACRLFHPTRTAETQASDQGAPAPSGHHPATNGPAPPARTTNDASQNASKVRGPALAVRCFHRIGTMTLARCHSAPEQLCATTAPITNMAMHRSSDSRRKSSCQPKLSVSAAPHVKAPPSTLVHCVPGCRLRHAHE